jgi:hypothetical protein
MDLSTHRPRTRSGAKPQVKHYGRVLTPFTLTNAAKHASTSAVRVGLAADDTAVRLSV